MRITTLEDWFALVVRGMMMACLLMLGANLGPGGVGVLILLGLIRQCWIEDNLYSDLLYAKTLPNAYHNTLVRRAQWRWWLLGEYRPIPSCPKQVACALRQQGWDLQGVMAGLLAGLVSTYGGTWIVLAMLLGWYGMMRFERSLAAANRLDSGHLLPFDLVAGWTRTNTFLSSGYKPKKPEDWRD